ncbi:MAG: GatB/YqeY domain-containing protein [Patescibacteria group bacterium]|jgi:hypothetical protein
MTTRERIDADCSEAAKARQADKLSTLRLLRAALKYVEIEKMKPLAEEDVIEVVGRELKKLRDALESYVAGKRADLAAKAEAEMAILQAYLPEQLGDEALKELVRQKIAVIGTVTAKDFGRVMSEVMKEAKGKADGTKVSAAVKEIIAASSS